MVSHRNLLGRDMLFEGQLGLEGSLGIGSQPYPFRDTEDVRVDRHDRAVEEDGLDDVGGFAAYSWKGLQQFHIVGNHPAEVGHQLARHTAEVPALVVGVRDRLDVSIYLLDRGGSHGIGIGKSAEECRCHHVDTLVGALRRENHRHKQLEGILVVELALGIGPCLLEIGYQPGISFFGGHLV